MEEIWKDIPEFETKYQASTFGQIKSLEKKVNKWFGKRTIRERILRQCNQRTGYKMVSLGKKYNKLVHRLVAHTFIPNPENKPCVNHKDGDKANNFIENLEWVTYSENEKHSFKVLGKKPNKTNLGNLGILAKDSNQVARYSLSGDLMAVYGSASEAARVLNRCQGRISTNCRGETKKCYKSKFVYINRNEYFNLKNKLDEKSNKKD